MVQNVWDTAPAVAPRDSGLVSAVPLHDKLVPDRAQLICILYLFTGPPNTVKTLFSIFTKMTSANTVVVLFVFFQTILFYNHVFF